MALFNYECDEIKRKIEEVSPNYPQLTTYTSEWLYFYENEYNAGTPVELEYKTVNISPSATVLNAIPYQYKSAVLKGNTDENLQSVNMPVLTTTGENLIDSEIIAGWLNVSNGEINNLTSTTTCATKDLIKVKPSTKYSVYNEYNKRVLYAQFNEKQEFINFGTYAHDRFTTDSNAVYIRLFFETPVNEDLKVMLYEGVYNPNISYEPYQSNILTVNEDITLRSNGSVYDELDLLTGKLTKRIDDNNEVLSQEVVKTVGLTPLNKPYEGTNHYQLTANIPCEAVLEVPIVSTGEQTLEEINND